MSNNISKLEALRLRIQEVKQVQELINLLDSMGFFALLELFKQEDITNEQIFETLVSYAGSIIEKLRSLQNFKNLMTKTSKVFSPT